MAPAILILIAVAQIVAATFTELSPWKGGGFGMFSTSDSPGTRFIYAEGTLADGTIVALELGFRGIGERSPLTKMMGRRLTTAPSQRALDELAERLTTLHYVRTGATRRAAYESFLNQNPEFADAFALPELAEQIVLRPIEQSDHAYDDLETVRLASVRLEMWKLTYQEQDHGYRSKPLGLIAEASLLKDQGS